MGDRGFAAPPDAIADLWQQDAGRFPRWEWEQWLGEGGAIGYRLSVIGYCTQHRPVTQGMMTERGEQENLVDVHGLRSTAPLRRG